MASEKASKKATYGKTFSGYDAAPVMRRSVLYRSVLVGLVAFVAFASVSNAQWRIKTPRDTIYVPATSSSVVTSNILVPSGSQIFMTISGTFGIITGQNGTGLDARYTYAIPNWNAPFPITNPPSWNGSAYQTYLAINPNALKEDSIKVLETSYQPNHVYTAKYTSSGPSMRFRIWNRLQERPDGYYYKFASGGLNIALARWTAGVALQSTLLDFSSVNINSTSTLLDSLASYGLDPLQIDSVVVVNEPGSTNFQVTSQHSIPFTLPTENTNEFRISFTPSHQGDINGQMYIYSHNADGGNRMRIVSLHGIGAKATLSVGPRTLNFGKVRIGAAPRLYANIYNGGNGVLNVTSVQLVPDATTFTASPSASFNVSPSETKAVGVTFRPTALQKYSTMLRLQGNGVPTDSVLVIGEGAAPQPVMKDSSIDFGKVKNKDAVTKYTSMKNFGNYTASIIYTAITGPNKSAFRLSPPDSIFLLDPDSTRNFQITYSPGAGYEGDQIAYLEISYDNGQRSRVDLHGYEVEPHLFVSRKAVDFGKVRVNFAKADTISLINSSNLTMTLDAPRILPFTNPEIFHADPLATIPGNSSQLMHLSFKPDRRGQLNAWLHLTANGQADSVYLFGTGAIPKAYFNPGIVDFGIVASGKPSIQVTSLGDSGDYPLYVTAYSITGPDQADFSVVAPQPKYTVNPGEFTNISVQFQTNAKTGQDHFATLHVIYEDGTSDSVFLKGREQAQYVEFGKRSIDFGKIRVNTHKVDSATFSNGSNTTLTVGNVWITQPSVAFTAGASTITVQKQDVGKIAVDFYPTTRGAFVGQLHGDGGNFKTDSITLTGSAGQPIPQFNTKLINFGTVILPGTGMATATLDLQNVGDWPLVASSIRIEDAYGEFTIDYSQDALQENAKHTYNLIFTLKTPQLLHTGNLIFLYDDSTSDTIRLQASDESPYLVLDSNHLDFGKIRIGPAAATKSVHLINTSLAAMTAGSIALTGDVSFTSSVTGSLTVPTKYAQAVDISFKPTAMGVVMAQLVATGGQINGSDTVFISGVGAAPKADLSVSVLDFGAQLLSTSVVRSFTLKNVGNWPMHVTSVTIIGNNQIDFTDAIPQDFTLEEDSSLVFTATFLSQSPMQPQPRTANLVFTLDDGSTVSLPLIARDRSPLITELAFGSYLARPGDIVVADLKLKTAIPDTLRIHQFNGTITFDSTLVELKSVEKGNLTSSPDWVLTTSHANGVINYSLQTTTGYIANPGSLLRLTFAAHGGTKAGEKTSLHHTVFDYPGTREVVGEATDGFIVIDSSCGSTHVTSGVGIANYIDQNSPNPASQQTVLPIDISNDATPVTLKILDVSGRVVLELANGSLYNKGHFDVPVDVRTLRDGTYFYQFQAGTDKPVVKKMIVTK